MSEGWRNKGDEPAERTATTSGDERSHGKMRGRLASSVTAALGENILGHLLILWTGTCRKDEKVEFLIGFWLISTF